MNRSGQLSSHSVIAFATIVDVERAKRFYRDMLGLTLMNEVPPFALVFDANGVMVRLQMAKKLPEAYGTVLGWRGPEIGRVMENLRAPMKSGMPESYNLLPVGTPWDRTCRKPDFTGRR